jgi:hypothetical protein
MGSGPGSRKATEPQDRGLYAKVKRAANARFLAPTSAYKSAWIVREYKKQGGKYAGPPPPRSAGLRRWFKEKWVDVRRGDKPCGRSSAKAKHKQASQAYPFCRPTVRVSKDTPTLLRDLSPAQVARALKRKSQVRESGRVRI